MKMPLRRTGLVFLAYCDRLLTVRRVRFCAALFFSVGLMYAVWPIAEGHAPFDNSSNPIARDFIAKAAGGRIALMGRWHELYDVKVQHAVEQKLLGRPEWPYWNGFVAPPFAAYLFAPFAALPYLVAVASWTLFSAGLITASLWLLWPLVPSLHRYGLKFVLLVVFSSFPVVDLLIYGQDSAVCLFLFALGLRLLLKHRDATAGAVLGLGVFKVQFFLLVPVLLLLDRRYRALGGWLAVGSALTFLSVALVGAGGVHTYLHLLTNEFRHDGVAAGQVWNTPSLFGLTRALRAYLPPPLGTAATALMFGIGVILLIQWLDRARLLALTDRELEVLYAGMMLAVAVVNPHLLYYDAVILLAPALLLYEAASASSLVRALLATAYLMGWSYILLDDQFFVHLPGPLPLLSAPWVVVPLIGLFEVAMRLLRTQPRALLRPSGTHVSGVAAGAAGEI